MAEEAQEVQPGSEEYNQQMIEKFNQEAEPEVEQPLVVPMPEGGHEKFYDPKSGGYDWESHARELEFNKAGRQKPEESEEEPKLQIETPTTDEEALNIVNQAGLDPQALEQAIRENGDIDETSYEALKKVGLNEDLVKSYIDNLNYRIQAERDKAFSYAGGEETFKEKSQWAVDNHGEAEITGIHRVLASPDWRMAVDTLRSRMGDVAAPASKEPQHLRGETVTGNQSGYRSKQEMKTDMSNPLYEKDPAFRQDVMRKVQTATWDLDTAN